MHVATTTKTTKIPAKNIKTFANRNQVNWTCASIVQLVEMFFHFFFSFFNKSHAVAAATWQAAQPKGGQKNNAQPVAPFCLPHAARAVCCQATSRSQPGPEHSLQQDQTLPSQRQVRFSYSRSWLDLCLLYVLSTFISSNHTVVLPDIGNNPMQTTVVMLKHKLNVGYKTTIEPANHKRSSRSYL